MKLEFDAGALRPIGPEQWDRARRLAAASPRRRAIVRYHDADETLQRMLNAIEPGSYVRPHRHPSPEKLEVLFVVAGALVYWRFDDEGTVVERLELSADGPLRGVETQPGTWHSMKALAPGTVFYELSGGGWDPGTAKEMAPWAPEEGTPEGEAYLGKLT